MLTVISLTARVRLVGGVDGSEGFLQIYKNYKWGSVCDYRYRFYYLVSIEHNDGK